GGVLPLVLGLAEWQPARSGQRGADGALVCRSLLGCRTALRRTRSDPALPQLDRRDIPRHHAAAAPRGGQPSSPAAACPGRGCGMKRKGHFRKGRDRRRHKLTREERYRGFVTTFRRAMDHEPWLLLWLRNRLRATCRKS